MTLTEEQMAAAYARLTTSRNAPLRPIDLLEIARDDDISESDRLDALTVVQYMRADLDLAEYYLLDTARASGTSWPALGAALGVTRQGAERRLLRGTPDLNGGRDADRGRAGRRRTRKQA